MQYYTLKVLAIRKETVDAVTVCFKQPALKKIKYSAGQYLTLLFRINGRRYIRPYSFSSAPGIDETLNVTVKRVSGGIVSNHIIDKLNIDEMVEVMEPMGDFTLEHNLNLPDTHIVLWGAGSGITPLISIAKYALHANIVNHVTLVYGNRSFESTIFIDQITQLQQQYGNNFSIWHFHTQPTLAENNPYLVQGRIDPDIVLSVIKEEGDVKNTLHYICGPIGLKESVKTTLAKLNIPEEQIYTEDFEVVRNPEDFNDIITRAVTVNKNNECFEIEVTKGKSILEAGLDGAIELAYSCQTGNCLVCKARLVKGEVKMIGVAKIPKELNSDERLLCCSFPLTNNVELVII